MSEFLTWCAENLNLYIAPFEQFEIWFNDTSPIVALFSFCRCFPFFFLCVCLAVVAIFALIKSMLSSKNYI